MNDKKGSIIAYRAALAVIRAGQWMWPVVVGLVLMLSTDYAKRFLTYDGIDVEGEGVDLTNRVRVWTCRGTVDVRPYVGGVVMGCSDPNTPSLAFVVKDQS